MSHGSPFLYSMIAAALSLSSLTADVPVIPRPARELAPDGSPLTSYMERTKKANEVFVLGKATPIEAPAGLSNEVSFLKEILQKAESPASRLKPSSGRIVLKEDASLPKEGYVLKCGANGIQISGGSAAGVFYGLQSLHQMMMKGGAAIPFLTLEDAPSVGWRGAMMDSARHFQNKEFVKKFIDLLSLHKLNRMHWHLVDSEGWRLEIKKYPKLVEVAKDFPAVYPGEDPTDKTRPAKFMYGHFHGGGYFTQEDIREIVAFAKSRHVEIMPEIEFPGHAMLALTAYPEFGTTGKVPNVRSNISVDLFAPNEKALGFLKDILDETMELFPFEVIHFGGDESPKGQWKNSPEVQAKIKELGLKDENQLQAWMFNELAGHIAKKGRRPAGWEEIMHGHNMETLTKSAVVMPWLSMQNAIKSANEGHGIIHSQTGTFYFDSWQTDSPADNWTLYKGPLTLERVYNFNMFPSELTEEGKKNVYGAQAQLWSELMTRPEHVEYQAYPRLTALAEMTWTPQERKDYKDFYKRLVDHARVLDAYKVNYRYINPLPVAEWNRDVLEGKGSWLIPLTPDQAVDMVAQFDYKGGASGFEIKKVELLRDGKVISTDEHDGFTGTEKKDHFYRLKAGKKAPGKYALRVTHANQAGQKADSRGEVTLFTGKGLELFNPRNFAGGDYPSAIWTSDDTKGQTVAAIRIPMDGLIKTPGMYELVFDLKQGKSPVLLGGIEVTGTGGSGSASAGSATLRENASRAILPLTLKEGDIRAGNSISFKLKSSAPSQPSSGEVRVRLTKELPRTADGKYAWSPEVLSGGSVVAYVRQVPLSEEGRLTVNFDYKGGGNALDIKGVQVLKKGVVVAADEKAGFAGSNPRDNHYTIESPALKKGERYDLRLVVAGSGGNDSHGEVTIK